MPPSYITYFGQRRRRRGSQPPGAPPPAQPLPVSLSAELYYGFKRKEQRRWLKESENWPDLPPAQWAATRMLGAGGHAICGLWTAMPLQDQHKWWSNKSRGTEHRSFESSPNAQTNQAFCSEKRQN